MTEQTEQWNAQERKNHPIFTGVLRYFPDALLEVAALSKIGNDQHNPGQALHWDRSKSQDQGDALVRHQIDAGTRDTDGVRHSAKVAWRALAQLQLEIEADSTNAGDFPQAAIPNSYRHSDGWSPERYRNIGDVWRHPTENDYIWDGYKWQGITK